MDNFAVRQVDVLGDVFAPYLSSKVLYQRKTAPVRFVLKTSVMVKDPVLAENSDVVVKVLTRSAENEVKLSWELRAQLICSQNKHPNILPVYPLLFRTKFHLAIVMDYVESRPLSDFCFSSASTLTALRILLEIALGLREIHRLGIVHCDIKRSNVLLAMTADGTEQAKIIDFGSSRRVGEMRAKFLGSTPYFTETYAPPEAFLHPGQAVGEKFIFLPSLDIWAYGILMIRLYKKTQWAVANQYDDSLYGNYLHWFQTFGCKSRWFDDVIMPGLGSAVPAGLKQLLPRLLDPDDEHRCDIHHAIDVLNALIDQDSETESSP